VAAADDHARQRFFGNVHWYARLPSQSLVQTSQESPATHQNHPADHDVRGQFGGVRSRVSRTAAMIASTGTLMASLTSSLVITTVFGSPVTRSLPLRDPGRGRRWPDEREDRNDLFGSREGGYVEPSSTTRLGFLDGFVDRTPIPLGRDDATRELSLPSLSLQHLG
jgi:hypothetical protein